MLTRKLSFRARAIDLGDYPLFYDFFPSGAAALAEPLSLLGARVQFVRALSLALSFRLRASLHLPTVVGQTLTVFLFRTRSLRLFFSDHCAPLTVLRPL